MKPLYVLVASLVLPAMIGCSANFSPLPQTSSASGVTIKGSAYGGQQPLTGSHIYLFAAGKTGYGSASTSLLNTGAPGVSTDSSLNGYVTTDASGSFSITGDYTCANGSDQVYLLALGGNPGLAAGTNNAALAEIDLLGACSTLSSSTFVVINEVSTVAAATALSQFIVDPTHIGTSSTNATGFLNAVTTALNLSDIAAGSARASTRAGNGTVPQATVNTLADILASCINTQGSSSTQCTSLFSAATPAEGSAPVNTLNAAVNITKNATRNVATLFGLVPASPPFQPVLTTQPADWTVGISYTLGVAVGLPGYIALDGSGNVWVANRPSGTRPGSTDAIVKLGPDGQILSGTGFTNSGQVNLPEGLAIDDAGTVWIANTPGNVLRLNNDGSNVTGFPVSGTNFAQDIALDRSGNAWVTNFGGMGDGTTVTEISNGGTVLVAGATSAGFSAPQGISIDSLNNVWAAGQGSNSLLELSATGTVKSGAGAGFTGGGLNGPAGVAIDHLDRVWVADSANGTGSATLSLFNNDGTAVSTSAGFGFGSTGYVNILSIDGASTAWTASCGPNCVGGSSKDLVINIAADGTVLNAPGFANPALSSPQAIAADASGNIWVGNSEVGTVTQFVGVAVPVKTPIQAGLKTALLGARP